MNLTIKALLLIFIFTGCATKNVENLPLSPQDKRISSNFNSVDSRILGTYVRKQKKDPAKFKESDYMSILNSGKSEAEKEVREMLALFTTREFIPYKNTFVFCAFSPRLQIAFCDDAYCEPVEQFVRTSSVETLVTLKAAIATPGVCKPVGVAKGK